MIEKLKEEIKILKDRKEKLRNTFYEYELAEHISIFTEIRGVDIAIGILNKMLLKALEENENI